MTTSRQSQALAARARRAEFAERLTTGMSLAAAGREMGIGQARSGQFWRALCEDLTQAVSEDPNGLVRVAGSRLGLSSRAASVVWEAIVRETDLMVERPEGRVRR